MLPIQVRLKMQSCPVSKEKSGKRNFPAIKFNSLPAVGINPERGLKGLEKLLSTMKCKITNIYTYVVLNQIVISMASGLVFILFLVLSSTVILD